MNVKPLEWKEYDAMVMAHSVVGMFTIEEVDGGYVYTHHQNSAQTKGFFDKIEDAKHRCFEMFEQKILSAIERGP